MTDQSTPIFILADDLTGAADAASYFRTPERRVRIGFDSAMPWDFRLTHETVQVFDAETRHLSPEVSFGKVLHACAHITQASPGALVYKKVDSTLRGNIGAEIEAAVRGLNRNIAVLAPAFPAGGRTVIGGVLYVHGVPVNETAFANDPHHPILSANVAEHVRTKVAWPTVQLDLSTIRQGADAVEHFLADQGDGPVLIVADTEVDEDLAVLAEVFSRDTTYLPCGSAGLARQLAKVWTQSGGACDAAVGSRPPRAQRQLYVIGSANQLAREQVQELQNKRVVRTLELSATKVVDDVTAPDEIAAAIAQIAADDADITVLTLSPERVSTVDRTRLVDALAQVAKAWVHRSSADFGRSEQPHLAVFATGGDTALACCKAVGYTEIWPEGELLPGIPWSFVGGQDEKLTLVSKAGGFGDAQTLCSVVHRLCHEA
ncbi:four-carbon acid sugar kinase family protein [Alicyclobacillus suci]|uniref:four-carbon acid sugar kinase family protein n=1 Tax=Alicyclobacillus suci TaxID=2816080 RepID=UPI001A8C3214|nr:four-carbon acid sugar kinase family protein [Alicyclobacillus suci]